jgi:hypothetical protein
VKQRKAPAEPGPPESKEEPERRAPEHELVRRLEAVIVAFALDQRVPRALVQVEFNDGTRFALHSISPEPGMGFVTIMPYPEDLPDAPGAIVVPVGSIRRIELDRAEAGRGHLGFTTLGE